MAVASVIRLAAALALHALVAEALIAQARVRITEFPIGGNPIPIAVGSDGNFWTWFSGTNSVGRMTPSGVATIFQTTFGFPGATPGHCVGGRDGGVWCATFGSPVVRISVATGVASGFPLPTGAGASDITLGPDGALWFADTAINEIGRMTVEGVVMEYALPASFVCCPRSITVGPDGALWFVNGVQAGRLDITGSGFRSFDLPDLGNPDIQVGSIAKGSDGNLWICIGSDANHIVRATPDGQTAEFPLPTPLSEPLDIVAGPDGALWFTEEGADKIGRITTGGALTEYALPQPLSGPVGITVGPDRAIWFTELAGRIGRLSGGPLAVAAVPALSRSIAVLLALALAACGALLLSTRQ